jgi:glucokinase
MEFGTLLGRFLYPLLSRLDAGVLVIGGNIANAGDLFIPAIQNIFESEDLHTEIKVSGLKEEAALLGAAHLIDNDYFQKIKPLLELM